MMRNSSVKQVWGEFFEVNWRLWSFAFVLLLVLAAILLYPVKPYLGYGDPFYSPTVLILPLIALFRLSCYAFRKGYYRHVFSHPQACLNTERVDKEGRNYTGETGFFSLENFHRYFLYLAIIVLPFFYYDIYYSMFYQGGFLVFRVGTIIMVTEVIFVTLWTFSCHAFRHLIGGYKDCYSCTAMGKGQKSVFNGQSILNRYHEVFAYTSLLLVATVDIFIRALVLGWPIDFTFFKIAI